MIRPSRRRRQGFVLIEVLVSLMILGVSLMAITRSLTQSMKAVRLIEIKTQAQFFAMQVMHEIEINQPFEGDDEGGFGDDYKEYSFRVHVEYERPNYGRIEGAREIDRFFPMRRVTIEINYQDKTHPRFTPLTVETALVGFEKMSMPTKQSYGFF